MKRLNDWMAKFNEFVCVFCSCLLLLLVAILVFEVTLRYVFNEPTIWAFDISYMLGAAFSTLGFGYLESHRGNTRVDPIYALLSRKYQLVIDVFFNTFLYLPGFILLTYAFFRNTQRVFLSGERFNNTFWLPPMWPINVVITIGYVLFVITYTIHVIQDIQEFIQILSAKGKQVPEGENA